MLFYLTVAYLLLEFGRPQDLVPALAPLHLPGVVSACLVLAMILSRRIHLSDKQTRLFALLLALMALHVPLARNNYWALWVAKDILIDFIVYLAIVKSIDSRRRFRTFIALWLGVHVVLAIHGIVKQGQGVGGFLGDENDFAMTLNMIVPFSFFLALSKANRGKKVLYMGLTGLFMLANIFTFSRGGFVGLAAVGLYCWLSSPKKFRSAAVIAALGLLVSLYAREGYWQRLQSGWEEGASAGTGEGRVYMWKIGWKMFLDNSIIGVGQGNFPWQFDRYEGEQRLNGRSEATRAAHSLYLTLLPELGIVGALIFFGMLRYLWRDLRYVRRLGSDESLHLAFALEASLIGFLVSSIFISTLYYPNFWVTMGFVIALRRFVTREASRRGAATSTSNTLARHRATAFRPGLL